MLQFQQFARTPNRLAGMVLPPAIVAEDDLPEPTAAVRSALMDAYDANMRGHVSSAPAQNVSREQGRFDQLIRKVASPSEHDVIARVQPVAPEAKWKYRPAFALREIHSLLGLGRLTEATQLVAKLRAIYPSNLELFTLARLTEVAEAKVVRVEPQSRLADFQWLKDAPVELDGKWVALVDGQLLASADTLKALIANVKDMGLAKRPLIHKIPSYDGAH